MSHTDEDVLAAFPASDAAGILAALAQYGTQPWEREVPRVQLAILELSGGSCEKLQQLVASAKINYRDILAWQQLGPLLPEEGARYEAEARSVIRKWGKT